MCMFDLYHEPLTRANGLFEYCEHAALLAHEPRRRKTRIAKLQALLPGDLEPSEGVVAAAVLSPGHPV